jgi:hypothetical protein
MKYGLMVALVALVGCGGTTMDDSQLGKNYNVPNAFDPTRASTRSERAQEASCQSNPAVCEELYRRPRSGY